MTDENVPSIEEAFHALGDNKSSTAEDYKQFYLERPNLTPEQHAKNWKAQADLWYGGNMLLAILSDMAMSLGGWAKGMQNHGDQVGELIEIAKKGQEGGEDWKEGDEE